MCGIFGMVGDPDVAAIERACEVMHHRGPDDRGLHIDEHAGLGMTRLAILDLSLAGHQPMSSDQGNLWIVHNGEVYNFQEHRLWLEAKGHRLRSQTDTEVILRLYEELGPACVERLRGMFAFAIWDSRQRRLFLARDRLGIKPLFYHWDGRRLIFASEIKAMLAAGLVERRLSRSALGPFLTFGYVPGPLTSVEGIQALMPGHHLILEHQRLSIVKYWDVRVARPADGVSPVDEREAGDELRALLSESVRLRLISDVPVGAFLSGGLDSGAVVALMAEARTGPVKTFSVGFDEAGRDIDETNEAGQLARFLGTDHTRHVVSGRDVAGMIDDIGWALDQPSFDGINSYLVSQVARSSVTVALSGLGGDELFAGYPHFWRLAWEYSDEGVAPKIRSGARALAAAAGSALSPWVRGSPLEKVADWARVQHGFVTRYGLSHTVFLPFEQRRLCMDGWAAGESIGMLASDYLSAFDDPGAPDLMARVSRLDLKTYTPNRLLRDIDVTSMAHSLEVRVPLLDHKLVEFVACLPGRFKYQKKVPGPPGGERGASYRELGAKRILIAAVRDLLPPDYEDRPKSGFHLPMTKWMKNELRPILADLLGEESVKRRGLFHPAAVRRIYERFLRGLAPWHQVWSLAMLEIWHRQVLEAHRLAPAGAARASR